MFRWLTDEYPHILNRNLDGFRKGTKVDNLYLDMNGIIHPCTHNNEDKKVVYLDEKAMFRKIFTYVDNMYKMVQPKKVLYLAVDGVAPRAKMNQQRSRRFRAAKEAEFLAMYQAAQQDDASLLLNMTDKTKFDSNCITPGTDFMAKLSEVMQKWVDHKMETDPFWKKGARVILSGPDVPGEGEHKIMDFIREERRKYQAGEETHLYGPGWAHMLYGLDADLIMLGLVTHEKNFMLLREKMSVVHPPNNGKKKDLLKYTSNDFEIMELSTLRKVIGLQFRDIQSRVPRFSLNRVVDDFVFMCMLVGNDFLPHCPHLSIDSGGISFMLKRYMKLVTQWGGFLTDKEKIHPQRFEELLYHLASFEEKFFQIRAKKEKEPGWSLPAKSERAEGDFYGKHFTGTPTPKAATLANKKGSTPPPSYLDSEEECKKQWNAVVSDGPQTTNMRFIYKHPESKARSYRDFYYESKLGWNVEDRDHTLFQRRKHVRDYLEGLHWVLNYYHNGCASWDWYFPHLYSPLATDMVNLHEFYGPSKGKQKDGGFKSFSFSLGEPFPSLAQLLSVLPPQSSNLLPKALSELMVRESSPLSPFYPSEFRYDPNGKVRSWESVVILPFIDAKMLLDAVQFILEEDKRRGDILTDAERHRNRVGGVRVVSPQNAADNRCVYENKRRRKTS
eukprot:Nitzschia sp. Nitz4//scaffold141_size107518//35241//37253//NITZ4_004273-RA/size107518-processed-gene-0.107-mRNA-1//1//CDS//3329536279//6955//frame0